VSSHQVEGGNYNNWTVWELKNAKRLAESAKEKNSHLPSWKRIKKMATNPENYISSLAIDHYNRYEEDFDLVEKMNLNAFRFSIEWSRIEPKEGVWNEKEIEHYRRYIKALRKRKIEPILTLYHWTVPVWFAEKGAFLRAGNIKYFVRFAEKVVEELGSDLKIIITINEPDTVAGMGYFMENHPPAEHSLRKTIWVYRNHLRAHKLVYRAIKKKSRDFQVGFVKSYAHVMAGDGNLLSRLAVRIDHFIRDDMILGYLGRETDFIGVNYYSTGIYKGFRIVNNDDPNSIFFRKNEWQAGDGEVNDLGWWMQPNNLYYVLKRLSRRGKPIYVTETGVADSEDRYRKDWLDGTINSVRRAIADGADIRGYLHWSMFDNFEWAYGRWPCFGLVKIDYENNLRRVMRPSAKYYAEVIKKARS
jgi:beta-glucosidase